MKSESSEEWSVLTDLMAMATASNTCHGRASSYHLGAVFLTMTFKVMRRV